MSKGKHRNVKGLSSSGWKSRWVPGWALEGPNPCQIWDQRLEKPFGILSSMNHLGAVVPQGSSNKMFFAQAPFTGLFWICLEKEKNREKIPPISLSPGSPIHNQGRILPALQGDPKNPLWIISSQFLSLIFSFRHFPFPALQNQRGEWAKSWQKSWI